MDYTERTVRILRKECDRGLDIDPQAIVRFMHSTSRAECIALAGRLGIARKVTTKTEAVAAIVRWVRELPIAKQAISY